MNTEFGIFFAKQIPAPANCRGIFLYYVPTEGFSKPTIAPIRFCNWPSPDTSPPPYPVSLFYADQPPPPYPVLQLSNLPSSLNTAQPSCPVREGPFMRAHQSRWSHSEGCGPKDLATHVPITLPLRHGQQRRLETFLRDHLQSPIPRFCCA